MLVTLAALFAWIPALLLTGGGSAPAGAIAQETADCVETFAGVPPGPLAPTNVQIVPGVAPGLTWQNQAENARCIVMQLRAVPAASSGATPQDWTTFVTLSNPDTTSYSLPPIAGLVCFRLYAANDQGRSEYSQEACLSPQTSAQIATAFVGSQSGGAAAGAGTGGSTVPTVAVIIGVLAVASVVGMLVLRWRVARKV